MIKSIFKFYFGCIVFFLLGFITFYACNKALTLGVKDFNLKTQPTEQSNLNQPCPYQGREKR